MRHNARKIRRKSLSAKALAEKAAAEEAQAEEAVAAAVAAASAATVAAETAEEPGGRPKRLSNKLMKYEPTVDEPKPKKEDDDKDDIDPSDATLLGALSSSEVLSCQVSKIN